MVALLIVSLALGIGEVGTVALEVLPVEAALLADLPQAELKVTVDGRTTTYAGVPLAAVLGKRAAPIEGMPGIRDLADAVILVRGEDGYQAAVSAAAVAMDPNGERYLLATRLDGQARKPQLIIPADPKRARWVRDIKAIRLARLGLVTSPNP